MKSEELVRWYRWLRGVARAGISIPAADRLVKLLDADPPESLAKRISLLAGSPLPNARPLTNEEAWVLSFLHDRSSLKSGQPKSISPDTCLLGFHPDISHLRDSLGALARSTDPVLFVGERGCGKGQLMRAIDQRRQTKFNCSDHLAVSLATIPAELSDSALFGHEKGSFTGAESSRAGAFRTAYGEGRALFLDDIGDCSPTVQAKLLAAIDDGRFTPVGADYNIDLGRGTDRQLAIYAAIQPKAMSRLRADLLDRLAGSLIWLPPLRERGLDVLLIADHFLAIRQSDCAGASSLSSEAQEVLLAYEWPGNIRQISNVIGRASAASDNAQVVDSTVLSRVLRSERRIQDLRARDEARHQRPMPDSNRFPTLHEVVHRHISEALQKCQGNKTRAAMLLGIPRTTLYAKLASMRRSE